MRAFVLVSSFMLLAGCRSQGLTASDSDGESDFRSAAMTVTAVDCVPKDVADMHAYELSWSREKNHLTIDLYGVEAKGCNLQGGALVDHIANTLYMHFDASDCSGMCGGPQQSHVRLEMVDAFPDLYNAPTITISGGGVHPDLANLIVPAVGMPLATDYVRYIPTIAGASLIESSLPGKSLLRVNYANVACPSTGEWQQANDQTYGVPYVTAPSTTSSCNDPGYYFFDSVQSPTKVTLLSKRDDGTFTFVEAHD